MDVFWQQPPVTRTIAVSAFVLSLLLYGGLVPAYVFFFHPYYFYTWKPEVWRLVTSFLITGPKLGIIMDPWWVWQYGCALERESPRFSQPGDFFIYTIFCGVVIVATGGFGLSGLKFLDALILAYAYTAAQDDPTRRTSLFILQFEMKYLPYALLILTFILQSAEAAYIQVTGLVAAHLYDFLTRIWPTFGGGTNFIKTPAIVKQWFGVTDNRPQARVYGTAQAPRRQEPQGGQGGGWASGIFGNRSNDGWGQRGPGRRLG